MTHHQPVRRVSDNTAVTRHTLYDGDDVALDAMYDVDFRSGGHGKFVWTADGVDYLKQYLPPSMRDLESTPEFIIAQMDYAGVDRAVIQSGHLYGRLNDYIAEAVRRYPDRFWGLALVDEWKIDDPSEIRSLDMAIDEYGLHALWFNTGSLEMHRRDTPVDDPAFFPFWERVRALRHPRLLERDDLDPRPGRLSRPACGLQPLAEHLSRHPLRPHARPHRRPLHGRRRCKDPRSRMAGHRRPQRHIRAPLPHLPGAPSSTTPTARCIAQSSAKYYDRLGPKRLCWGSDLPNVERHATYRQSLAYLRDYCDFIPPDDMDAILGGNIAALFDA